MTDNPISYPDALEIKPLDKPPNCTVSVPGSKSITNRALVLAALYGHPDGCELQGVLCSEDTMVMVTCLRDLGFEVEASWPDSIIRVRNTDRTHAIPASDADLFVANSGTTMRFLTAMVALGHGRYRLDGVPRMRERPMEDLLIALRQLGVRTAVSEKGNGCPPVIVKASGLDGGVTRIKGDVSSQFISALMMVTPLARMPVEIKLEGKLVSMPYAIMTEQVMEYFGLCVRGDLPGMVISCHPHFVTRTFMVEPDASAASYFLAAAAISKSTITIRGLGGGSVQGDISFVNVLENMGCDVLWDVHQITVKGNKLHGIDADMNAVSDTVMTLAAVACFAEGPTTIRNVAHIRHKETDRITALTTELRKVGAEVEEYPDGLKITPRPLHGAEIETYNDHRMAMSMALIGLRVPGIVIKNPGCVAKTYPRFWEDLEKLRS